MTFFKIAKLTLASKTQCQPKYQEHEPAVLGFHTTPATFWLDGEEVHPLLARALKEAVPKIAGRLAIQEAGFPLPSVQDVLDGWRPIFGARAEPRQVWTMVRGFLEGEFVPTLEDVVSERVTVISENIPAVWRLSVDWQLSEVFPPDVCRLAFRARYVSDWNPD